MEHIAIDLGGRKSQICTRAADGTIVEERQWATRDLGEYLKKRPTSRVIVETCTEAFRVAGAALLVGHEVRVVPATLVRTLGVGERGTKTDKRDARKLSEVSCRIDLPSVHIPSQESRDIKTMLGMRDGLDSSRTLLINTVRGWQRAQAISISKAVAHFDERVRQAFTTPLPSYVERQLAMVKNLTEQILAADKEIAKLAKAHSVAPRLMSVPGIGPITAMQFVAVIDVIQRFRSAHDLEAYLGLTPGEHSSSGKQRRTSITKAGSTRLRCYLVQAARAARRTLGAHPMVDWSLEAREATRETHRDCRARAQTREGSSMRFFAMEHFTTDERARALCRHPL